MKTGTVGAPGRLQLELGALARVEQLRGLDLMYECSKVLGMK